MLRSPVSGSTAFSHVAFFLGNLFGLLLIPSAVCSTGTGSGAAGAAITSSGQEQEGAHPASTAVLLRLLM